MYEKHVLTVLKITADKDGVLGLYLSCSSNFCFDEMLVGNGISNNFCTESFALIFHRTFTKGTPKFSNVPIMF